MGTPTQPLGDTTHTVDPHSFFGSAPITPPGGGHPFSFGGGMPAMPTAQGPVNHPSLDGLRSLLSQLQAHHAQLQGMANGPSYFQRLQGGQAPFSDPALGARYAAASGGAMAGPAPVANPMQQTHAGYMQAMAPSWYGGATPAVGTSSGGVQRPMWMGPQGAPETGPTFDTAAWGKAHGFEPTQGGGLTPGQGSAAYSRLMNYRKNQDSLNAGHAQYMQGWNQNLAQRKAMVQQHAMNKSNARDFRLGIGDPLQMALMGNPELAAQHGLAQLGLQSQQMQNQLGWAELAQRHQVAQIEHNVALMQHIVGADLPPGLKAGYMDQLLGSMGVRPPGGSIAGGPPAGTTGQSRVDWMLSPKMQGEFRGLKTNAEKEAWLNSNGIVDPHTRSMLMGARPIHGSNPYASPDRPTDGDWAAYGLLNIPYWVNPFIWGGEQQMPAPGSTAPLNDWQRRFFGIKPQVGRGNYSLTPEEQTEFRTMKNKSAEERQRWLDSRRSHGATGSW
jgi:hypothetical protein